jgi:hypothetical protein
VKCDETHPICERCERTNRKCEGYTREHRFVDENARTERHAKKKVAKQESSKSPKSGSPTSTDVVTVRSSTSDLNVSRNLGLSGFEDNIHISFLLANLFSGIPFNPWLKLHAEDPASCAQMSIRALGAVYFGRMHHLEETTDRGSVLYGKALVNLNRDLEDSDKAWSMSVLKSAITLELYEVSNHCYSSIGPNLSQFIAFNSAAGWMKHAGGVGKLIELRGPSQHQNPAERELLNGNKITIALACLIKKKRCFLEHPDWKIIPWAPDPESKTSEIYLLDQLCDIPGLFEDATNLNLPDQDEEQRIADHQSLSRNILVHLRILYEWRFTWQQQNPDSCFEVKASSPDEQPLFPTALHYSTLPLANEIAIYNAILLLLLRLGSQIIGPTFDASIPSLHLPKELSYYPLYPPGSAASSQAVATEICRSIEYYLLDAAGSAGAFFLLFPMSLAYRTFKPGSREARWLSEVMRNIADKSGFEISRNISGYKAISVKS